MLGEEEKRIIIDKGAEAPFSEGYNDSFEVDVYLCKQCGAKLYGSTHRFKSHCGWPSFNDEINGAIKKEPNKDGVRTEILCANCNAHLGHIFKSEGFTPKNVRHCANSLSLKFMRE